MLAHTQTPLKDCIIFRLDSYFTVHKHTHKPPHALKTIILMLTKSLTLNFNLIAEKPNQPILRPVTIDFFHFCLCVFLGKFHPFPSYKSDFVVERDNTAAVLPSIHLSSPAHS